jgi:N-methylhydantoinase B
MTKRNDISKDGVDPITFSVILSRFDSIANEMTLTLEYTAWTSILALARDYSCAVFHADTRQICMFDALPIHTTSMHHVLGEMAAAFEGKIRDGDVFMCNHPYRKNTHVGDVVTATPVFVDGRHLFWSVTKGHQLDIGAATPSSVTAAAKNVWQEGLHIPPIKIFDAGEERSDVIDFYLTNLRYPDLLRGDLLAQLGSIGKGRVRLIELAQEYGPDVLMGYVDEIIAYADRRMSEEVLAMPDGIYYGEGWIDSDGAETIDIPIKVKVEIKGDRIHVDYTGSGPQSPSGVNGTFATSQAAAAIPFMYYIDPDIPHNHGCFQHVDVYAPEGTICNAQYPAATSLATIVPSDMMQDVINKALVGVLPDNVVAGGARCANMPTYSGIDGRTNTPWGAMLFNAAGGQGASKETDGWPLLMTLAALAGQKALPIEQIELLYPLLVHEMEVEPDSMGLGKWIGGPGIRFSVEPTEGPVECITFGDGSENPPHGLLGGTMGIGGGQYVEHADGTRTFISSMGYFGIAMGERHVGVSTGGGGYGNPVDRPVEDVRQDVRDEFVTREQAREVFGVVVDDGFDPVVDHDETERLRTELRKIERPLVTPTVSSAATWRSKTMRDGDHYHLNPRLS